MSQFLLEFFGLLEGQYALRDAIVAMDEDCKFAEVPAEHSEALAENMQNAKIILQCAKHQRRILDDVLTLSRLNSTLLSITPAAIEPASLVSSIVGMFVAELDSNATRCKVNTDTSFSDLSITQVHLDPSRVTQIFINLLTNAIKFVKSTTNPSITIRYGACLSDPRSFFPNTTVWADSKPNVDMSDPEWGKGKTYFSLSVSRIRELAWTVMLLLGSSNALHKPTSRPM